MTEPETPDAPAEPAAKPRRRYLPRPSLVIAVLLAAGAAAWIAGGDFQRYNGTGASAEEAEATPTPADTDADTDATAGTTAETRSDTAGEVGEKAIAVRVFDSVAEPRVAHLLLTGRTEADRRATLRAETEGRIVSISTEVSDRVEDGQVLIEIAPDDRMARLREARALVTQREIEFNAADKLSKKGFQSETARAQARAQLEAAQAQLQRIQVDLDKTTLEAPFAGIVQDRPVEVGDFAQVGDPLVHLVDLDPMTVRVEVSEREIDRVDVGARAEVETVAGVDTTGTVTRIAPSASSATRTFSVEIEIPNADGRMRDGVTARVSLPTRETIAHALSPAVLTLDAQGRVGVKAVDGDDRVVFHPVSILEDQADRIWVTGLPATLTIIGVGQEYVAEGARVRPVPDARFGRPGTPEIELDPIEREVPPRVSQETDSGVAAQ